MAASKFKIDPALLPQVALLDTGVVIRANGERPDDPDSPTCKAFWEAMMSNGREMVIAAPTVAEILRFGSGASVPRVRGVRVVAFDEPAAQVLATRFPDHVLKTFIGRLS